MNEQQLAAVKQALERMETWQHVYPEAWDAVDEEVCAALKQSIISQHALDKKAENARELGLDYEPVGEAYLCDKCQTPFDGAWECPNCGHRSATKESVYTAPPAQPAPAVTDLAAAIEYADARWAGVDVPIEWAHHFANAICTPPEQPAPAPTSSVEIVTENLVREGVNKHKARELAEHFYGSTPAAQPAPAQDQWLQAITEKIEAKLLSHRLSLHDEANDARTGYPLIDALCCGQADIEIGKQEVKAIAEVVFHVLAANTPPAQREWVGLTQEEIENCYGGEIDDFARAIEAKLKEKNNG